MPRPRLLDLFCGGGGAAMGYHRAGFDVVGVDLVRQPDYPFEFHCADALTFPLDGFAVVHASPPCKLYTPARNSDRLTPRLFDPYPDLVAPTRERLVDAGVVYVIENVPGAPLVDPVVLCGSSFRLDLRRHRLFESNAALTAPACDHGWQTPRFQSLEWRSRQVGKLASVVGVHGRLQGGTDTLELRQRAMGIDWLDNDALTQAIPPAYTEHIGRQLLELL